MRVLVAIPTYNEERYVDRVLAKVLTYAPNVLVIDDGSTDSTPCLLPRHPVEVIRHARNRGYGRSLQDAFRWAVVDGFDWIITMDCDEQHEPEAIPMFVREAASNYWDVVSGSRYLNTEISTDMPPANRRAINEKMTRAIRDRLEINITDSFCGFKAYRVDALKRLDLDVDGYAFPMQFWVQSVAAGLRITEVPVRLIYNDPNRTFGGPLNDDAVRLKHYCDVLNREIQRCSSRLPAAALRHAPCESCTA